MFLRKYFGLFLLNILNLIYFKSNMEKNSQISFPSIESMCTTTASSSTTDDLEKQQNCSQKLGERENGLSYAEILVNFAKGMIGPGCLSLPLAFKQAGLWTGLSLVFIFGFLNCICMLKLVKCSHLLSNRKGNSFLNYGNMAEEAILSSFRPIRRYAKAAKIFVNASIVTLQMGVSSVFYIFCGVHIKEFFDEFIVGPNIPKATVIEWMLILFPLFVLINFVRNLRPIAIISSIGNLLCICSLIFIFQHLIRKESHSLELPSFTNFNGIMAASGSILYSFEGQAMVLPLENRLKRPKQMLGPFGILSVGLTIVSLVYASSGFLGYISYGQNVRGSITLNLPQKEIQFSLVRLALTLVIYLGFVIQMYVIVDMLWPELSNALEKSGNKKLKQNKLKIELLFRTFLVGIAMTFAIAIPNLEEMIPLVGVTTGMLLAFVIPSLLDLFTWLPIHLKEGRKFSAIWLILEDLILVGVGIFGLIAGLRANLSIIFGNDNLE